MEYRAGMFVYALAFLLGVVSVQQLAALPTLLSLLLLLAGYGLFCVVGYISIKHFQLEKSSYITLIKNLILLFIIGFTVSTLYARQQLSYRLHESFIGKDVLVSGYINNIPTAENQVQRFEFVVKSYQLAGSDNRRAETSARFPRKIRLSWYYGTIVNASQRWQLQVRLKPPHGFINPGGFDYEGWLFQQGLHASGYVRKSELNRQLEVVDASFLSSITRLRQRIGQQIENVASSKVTGAESFALIKALAIGDKSSISKQQWRVLVATGTSHLMAISGLHIGLAALFAFVVIRRVVPMFALKHLPAQHVALSGGLFFALLYALIAGFSVPTQRAFIMLSVLSAMLLIRRNHRPVDALGFALVVVLVVDPLAVLSAGFWFSFSAVAVIFISISSAGKRSSHSQSPANTTLWSKTVSILKQWVRLQLLISVFLLPLSLFMFQQVSLISPLANLLLIPYVSFLVVPVVLLAICFSFLLPVIADLLFSLSANLLDLVWPLISLLAAQPYALWVQGTVDIIGLLILSSALCLLYFSRSLADRISIRLFSNGYRRAARSSLVVISVLMFISAFIDTRSALKSGEYSITVLDVGQGSAAVLQTQNHVLVFDSGAKFSDKLDAGSSVVTPYLRSQGIRSIDTLVISHGDADHIGGAQAILETYPEAKVIGQDIEPIIAQHKQACITGLRWLWDGVDFEFLSPPEDGIDLQPTQGRNNQSCVLRVSSNSGTVLFTGDIEKKVERQLLKQFDHKLEADVLIVPHHGSKTSSSMAFITAVDAKYALFSVGYKNRYRLPSAKVVSRYQALGSQLLYTANSGAITIKLTGNDGIQVERQREKASKYWQHRMN